MFFTARVTALSILCAVITVYSSFFDVPAYDEDVALALASRVQEERESDNTQMQKENAVLPESESIPDTVDNGFECPSSLLPLDTRDPWDWTFRSADNLSIRGVHNKNFSRAPQIVMMRLEKEKESPYFKKSMDSLASHKYTNVCVTESVDGYAWNDQREARIAVTGLNNTITSAGAIGCFLSHLSVWRLGVKYNIPILALEADTGAILKWNIDPNVYKDYDVLFVNKHHDGIKEKCRDDEEVVEGFQFGYRTGTGAMLYTNNNPERVKRVFKEELYDAVQVAMPIGNFINYMWKTKKLRVGSLCPHFFEQRADHESTISGNGYYEDLNKPSSN